MELTRPIDTYLTRPDASAMIDCSDGPLERATAGDLIAEPPLLVRFAQVAEGTGLTYDYAQMSSSSERFARLVRGARPDAFFIDGDHSLEGAMKDHLVAVRGASLIMHHDINSDACPHLRTMWSCLSASMRGSWNVFDFVDQYESVAGDFLGLGLLVRKT